MNSSSLLGLYDSWFQEWGYHTDSWPVDPLLLAFCMVLRSGKTKGETKMAPSELVRQINGTLAEGISPT